MKYATVSPVSNAVLKSFTYASKEEVIQKIARSVSAFQKYKKIDLNGRMTLINKVADVIEKRKEEAAKTISLEMGKPIVDARAEVQGTANAVRQFAQLAPAALESREYDAGMKRALTVYQPLGPLLTIMPWNFPFFLPFKNGVPSMLAGNTVILKPAPSVPQTGLLLEDIMKEAGYNQGEYQVLLSSNDHTESIISHPDIRGVAFTGSPQAGGYIASLAGKYIKKSLLELGGSDAFLVLDDADPLFAAQQAAAARLRNSGQACNNGKRFIIHKDVYDAFKQKLEEVVKDYKVGDPKSEDVKIGPLAREDLLVKLKEQVKAAIAGGAKVVYGDVKQLDTKSEGNFFTPIFLEGMQKSNPTYSQEFFGPVFLLFKVESDEEAIKLANDSNYGLAGSVISTNLERAEKVAKEIETGQVFINSPAAGSAALPFGGVKNSGYGRECGDEGFRYFTNLKTIAIP